MIIEKNTKYNQYSTKALRDRTNEKFDSIIMHTFMRIAHLKKDGDGFKSQYLHMGHFTIVYTIWCWIPLSKRNSHWWTSKELQRAILRYLDFKMLNCNVNKYLEDLVHLGLFELRYRGRGYQYKVKSTLTDNQK